MEKNKKPKKFSSFFDNNVGNVAEIKDVVMLKKQFALLEKRVKLLEDENKRIKNEQG